MADKFTVSVDLKASPQRVFEAWMSSEEHGAFTGDAAEIDPRVGGEHSEFSGYITGRTLELEPHRRIVQSWRTTEFPEGSPDSHLELLLEPIKGGTRLTLQHSQIPDGQGRQYEEGWHEHYFRSMVQYFQTAK
ncbi:MAG TPA: SRPBCC domain-containing protein [Anaerolineales bacterium]|nr:SRPBCC domain-containing protein [Anaerolineales bacterium]